MIKLQRTPAILLSLLFFLPATSADGQAVPTNIPDVPGESLEDRERERLAERHHALLSRFFGTGGFDMAPVTGHGAAYQGNVKVGMDFRSGDALFAFFSSRRMPVEREPGAALLDGAAFQYYYGLGYELSGRRVLGESQLAERTGLNIGLGVLQGEVSTVAFDVEPTYDLLRGSFWTVPVGVKLALARVEGEAASVNSAFVGLSVGVQWRLWHRNRLELK